MIRWIIWLLAVILTIILYSANSPVRADTIAQGMSTQGHRVRLTTDRCIPESGRSKQLQWGKTFSWNQEGKTIYGCGRLEDDTVLIEWLTPTGIDVRRYDVSDFTWRPNQK